MPFCCSVYCIVTNVNDLMNHTHVFFCFCPSASEMTYIVSGGALKSSHSLTVVVHAILQN